MDKARTKTLTASGMVKGAAGVVYWVVICPSGTGTADSADLRNAASTSLTATSVLALDAPATTPTGPLFLGPFNPPIDCPAGIFATLTNLTSITIGFN